MRFAGIENWQELWNTWPATGRAAIAVQRQLAALVNTGDDFGPVRRAAGVDVSYRRDTGRARAAAVVLSFPDLALLEEAVIEEDIRFPYVPGLLSFREVTPVLAALARLTHRPDVVLYDGQGVAHPRRFGLACHLGVLTGLACLGVAKSRLIGTYGEPGPARGARSDLMDKGEVIGAVLRTRAGVKPLFVSSGHRISVESAIDLVLACSPKWRLPETTRRADALAGRRGPMKQRSQELFSEKGFFCAESILKAVAEKTGQAETLPVRAATGFCSGMARTSGMCGALTGGVLALNLTLGRDDPEQNVDANYTAVQDLVATFKEKYGTINCTELTGHNLSTDAGRAAFNGSGSKEKCLAFTGMVSERVAYLLKEE